MAADQECSQEGDLQPQISIAERLLPVSRVRTIMKSSPDVENISQDALVAVTAATELFIRDIAKKVNSTKSTSDGDITYNDLASLVNTEDVYSFLDEIIPRKVLGRDILAARREAEKEQNGEGDSSADEGDGERMDTSTDNTVNTTATTTGES